MLFLSLLTTREALFGGAAGGGKSVALLAAALQFVDVPGYSALLLRRTFADLNLPESLIPLSHAWLGGTDAKYNGQEHQWTFPSGATLTFGYLDTEQDKYRYQGAAFQFIGFDELTQFTETQYTYLFSRLRRKAGMNVPLRMRAGSNPGGIGHDWVKRRFIDDHSDRDRVFIPSKLEDNPYLDREDYERSMMQLDPITRRQLRNGDWEVRADGGVFRAEWFRYYKISGQNGSTLYDLGKGKFVPAKDCQRFASMDVAGTEKQKGNDPDYSVIQVWDVTPRYDMVLVHQWRGQFEIPELAEKAVGVVHRYDVPYICVERNGLGLGAVQTIRRKGIAVRAINAKGDKIARSQTAQIRMEAGTVYVPSGVPWLNDLESEMLGFPNVAHDDQVDTLSHSCAWVQKIGGPPEYAADSDVSAAQQEKKERDLQTAERQLIDRTLSRRLELQPVAKPSGYVGYEDD